MSFALYTGHPFCPYALEPLGPQPIIGAFPFLQGPWSVRPPAAPSSLRLAPFPGSSEFSAGTCQRPRPWCFAEGIGLTKRQTLSRSLLGPSSFFLGASFLSFGALFLAASFLISVLASPSALSGGGIKCPKGRQTGRAGKSADRLSEAPCY